MLNFCFYCYVSVKMGRAMGILLPVYGVMWGQSVVFRREFSEKFTHCLLNGRMEYSKIALVVLSCMKDDSLVWLYQASKVGTACQGI